MRGGKLKSVKTMLVIITENSENYTPQFMHMEHTQAEGGMGTWKRGLLAKKSANRFLKSYMHDPSNDFLPPVR